MKTRFFGLTLVMLFMVGATVLATETEGEDE